MRRYNSNGAERLEAFTGRFGHKEASAEWQTGIAETGRGRIAVYLHHWNYFNDFRRNCTCSTTSTPRWHKLADDNRIPPGMGVPRW
ncbi:hypothetical protein [Nonomuraea rubra]|uniref:hypothetical protein n=1 Tax=Nonomuraea rubra TaxID=46180 RepID=UPI0031E546D3